MPYVITNTPDDPLAGAMRIMGALQVYLHPEVAANAIRHCVQRERQGEWNVIRVEVVVAAVVGSGEEGK